MVLGSCTVWRFNAVEEQENSENTETASYGVKSEEGFPAWMDI